MQFNLLLILLSSILGFYKVTYVKQFKRAGYIVKIRETSTKYPEHVNEVMFFLDRKITNFPVNNTSSTLSTRLHDAGIHTIPLTLFPEKLCYCCLYGSVGEGLRRNTAFPSADSIKFTTISSDLSKIYNSSAKYELSSNNLNYAISYYRCEVIMQQCPDVELTSQDFNKNFDIPCYLRKIDLYSYKTDYKVDSFVQKLVGYSGKK